jgi:hypothetical protein
MKTKVILLTILMLMALTPLTSASILINATQIGPTSITWQWDAGSGVNNASVDGLKICGFDPQSSTFILSDLNPGENHTMSVYSFTDSGTSSDSTLPATSTDQGGILDAFYTYMWAIAALILLFIGVKWVRIFSLLAWFPVLIGLVLNMGPIEALNFASIALWIYVILFIICPVLYIAKKTGY